MNGAITGGAAGLAATIPMTAVMLLAHRTIPEEERRRLPPKQITEKVATEVKAEPLIDTEARSIAATSLGHIGYGTVCGAIYGLVEQRIPIPGAAKGIIFGVGVWAGSYLGWLPAVGIRPRADHRPESENRMMIAAHIVYGAVLGSLCERLRNSR
jgi:uncharacterized membrane protein YagU involved in acid resistance